jgi:hypothetical protein
MKPNQIEALYQALQIQINRLQEIEKELITLIAAESGEEVVDKFMDWQNQRIACNTVYLHFMDFIQNKIKQKTMTSIDLHLEFMKETGISFSNQVPELERKVQNSNPCFESIDLHRKYITFLENKILNK